MPTAKVTSKGQVTIPKKVRTKLDIHPGDEVTFKENEQGEMVLEADKKSIKRLAGILHRPGQKKVSVEEMNEAIKQAAVDRFKRSL